MSKVIEFPIEILKKEESEAKNRIVVFDFTVNSSCLKYYSIYFNDKSEEQRITERLENVVIPRYGMVNDLLTRQLSLSLGVPTSTIKQESINVPKNKKYSAIDELFIRLNDKTKNLTSTTYVAINGNYKKFSGRNMVEDLYYYLDSWTLIPDSFALKMYDFSYKFKAFVNDKKALLKEKINFQGN